MTREETIRAVRGFFEAHDRGFVAVYLFGSVARGDAQRPGDVDIAVLRGSRKSGLERLETSTQQALEGRLGQPVDLVVLDDAPPDLAHRVLRDGILVAQTDRSKRVAWEVRSRAEYFDLLPFIHRIRRTPDHLR
jgi:predicted nucleotidyltransferase